MGVLDSVFGGNAAQTKQTIPGYVEDPSKKIGYGVEWLLKNGFQNPTDTQWSALSGIEQQAKAGTGIGTGATSALNGILGTGGLNAQQNALAQNLIGGQAQNPAMAGVSQIASGANVGQNPYSDATFQQAAKQVTDAFNQTQRPGLDSSAEAAGRLGSGAYAHLLGQANNQLGQNLNNLATNIYGNAYNTDRQNQLSALGLQGQLGQQDVQNQLQGAGLYQQGTANQLNGIGLGGQAQNLAYDDLSRLYAAGTQENQQAYEPFQWASNIVGGLQHGGTNTATQQSSPFNQILGSVAGIGSALSSFGGSGGAGATGTNASGAAGGLANLAAVFSDRRLKRNIKRLASLPSGAGVYSYSYLWEPHVARIGVMADEQPQAAFRHESGFMMVDYGRIA